MSRIGVFVCHCGENIASTVDVEQVAAAARAFSGVADAAHYQYMCSEPGQDLVRQWIRDKQLTGVVVASCSPRLHEPTFRKAAAAAGLNPFLCEMANIREHCSWVHTDRARATAKAIELVRAMVAKVRRNEPLTPIRIPVTRRALVVGGGVAGIQAALDIANAGHDVVLVERGPSIGGHMAQLSETFPTLDCSQCILTPKMVEVAQHPLIKLRVYSEIESVDGYVGNFTVTIRQKATSVRTETCTGCGACQKACVSKKNPSEFEEEMGTRPSIYVPFPQAVPNKPVIDRESCVRFKAARRKKVSATDLEVCGKCAETCPTDAIDFGQEDELLTEEVGAIVAATGFDVEPTAAFGEYGYGKYPDVVTGLQFERLLSASGPTGGRVLRPSDQTEPKRVVFVQCTGSRDDSRGIPYCSKICCMYAAKQAMLYKHKVHDSEAYVFYMDIRAGGKGYEEFVRRAVEEDRILYLRGRVSRIYQEDGKLIVQGADTLSGQRIDLAAEMVVLATAARARGDSEELAKKLGISYDAYGFLSESHPKLRPVETNTAGIFIAGACQAPKDIPETVAQASAAASKVLSLLSTDELEREPVVASVDRPPPPVFSTCVGCFQCRRICPYDAIEEEEIRGRDDALIKVVARVNEAKCQGCGSCVAACKSQSIALAGFTDEQVYEQIVALGV